MAHDLNMLRAALLYAGTVELLSPVAVMIGGVASLQSQDGWLDLLETTDEDTLRGMGLKGDPNHVKALLARYRAIEALPRVERRRALGKHAREFTKLKASFDQHIGSQEVGGRIGDVLEEAGAPELVEALEAGVLTIRDDIVSGTGNADEMFDMYAERLKELLATPSTHLLLDESTAGLAHALIDEGHVAPADLAVDRAARARTGAGLVAHLPAFPNTTIGAVLEARTDLATPLAHYRAGVKRLNDRLVTGPFDPGYQSEVDEMWRDEVAPVVDRLRDDLSKTRLAYDAATNLAVDIKSVMGAGLVFFGVDTFTNVHELAAGAAAATPVLGKALASAHKEATVRKGGVERHEFFYLLELDKRL